MSKESFTIMSNDEYHSHDALGSSDVRRLMISPLHFEGREEPAVRPPHFTFGSAAHCGYLEPEKFEERYRAKPLEVDGKGPRTNHYREWMANQLGVEWMNAEDYDKVLKVIDSAVAHPITNELFGQEVMLEGSLFFEINGVECKARPDLVSFSSEGIDVIDLKTTTDASPSGFRKTCAAHKLFVQEWFYRRAMEEAGMAINRFIFLCVEKTAPFAAAAYSINPADVAEAEGMVKDALNAYVEAKETEVWKGYTSDITEVSVPPWALPNRTVMPNGNWLTVKQAAERFSVSRVTLYNWMNKGVDSKKFAGRRFLSAKSLAKLMK